MSFCFSALQSSTIFNRIILRAVQHEGFTELTPALLGIFAHLSERDGMSVSALAVALGSTRQAAHKHVGKLASSGYIELQTRPDNRKEKVVMLTPRGEVLVNVALKVIADTEAEMGRFLGRDVFEQYLKNQEALLHFLEALERGEGT
ncbi:MarR family transcriptional regulator [Sulfurimonas sp. HSL-3221]|uniref:MarR family winged helix-turn-helix transcriptional regulator n=1 Tax=Sulfurimonadaceae TaxID=2771471 RepID=UPI001E32D2FA|nr:MarR family transcriptional regulator [Sulfurimonas sp. HSL-3221]UFS63585.1 MarR family transcriptional regulator [Sulfurimonas sp. HSL-3221]